MLSYERARAAADHLKALAEFQSSRPVALITLLIFTLVIRLTPEDKGTLWLLGMVLGLLVTPILLQFLLPRGNLGTFRLTIASYPINGLLLGFIIYMLLVKTDTILLRNEELLWLIPLAVLFLPLIYYVIQFPVWEHRISSFQNFQSILAAPPDAEALSEISQCADRLRSSSPKEETLTAEFRTVPATPGKGRNYWKIDLERHGLWKVALDSAFALVLFQDGTRAEAVPRGELRIVAEEPKPGSTKVVCLIRWNQHLHEGRISPEHFSRIRQWNAGLDQDKIHTVSVQGGPHGRA